MAGSFALAKLECLSTCSMSVKEFDLEDILANWDTQAEQRKADFLEILYDFYCPNNGLYTGLFQRFQRDLVDYAKLVVTEGVCDISEIFLLRAKLG